MIIAFALFDLLPHFAGLAFDRKYLPVGGLIAGFFGGLSGNQGVLRSAFLLKAGLDKEVFIGTAHRYRKPLTAMIRDFFLGFVKIHILHHAAQEPVYGLALIEELRHHGYALSPGTLYPILHQLAAKGYLLLEERVVGGKVRKYYTITALGNAALVEARQKIQELVTEVLEGHDPTS